MTPGELLWLNQDDIVLWPSLDSCTTGTTINRHPRLRAGDVILIIDDSYGPQLGPGTHRVRVLTGKGIGWVSVYALESSVA